MSTPYVIATDAARAYVELGYDRTVIPSEVDLLERVVGGRCERDVIERAAANSKPKVPHAMIRVTPSARRTPFGRALRVAARAELCREVARVGRSGGDLFLHWFSLCEHHLLTCFDTLGQEAGWLPFGNWLSSTESDHLVQRQQAVSKDRAGQDSVADARALLATYNARFGVLHAFRHYLLGVLTEGQRTAFLEHLRIDRRSRPGLEEVRGVSEEAKIDYLFRIRNEYTHDAEPGRAFEPLHGNPAAPWALREQIDSERELKSIYVRDWFNALDTAVADGLANRIRALAS